MRNFIPERMVRATGRMMRMNIDDGDIFIGEFANGALGSIQTSFVTVGNYPGIEARLYGSKGALICRLVEEDGICERLWSATPDQVEFQELPVPERFYPPGGNREESWRSLFYANLVSSFIGEILAEAPGNEGNFDDGAWVQETINAVEQSFRERRWVDAAAGVTPAAALDRFFERYYRRRPVTATFTGVHAYDDALPDWSPDGLARSGRRDARAAARLDAAGRVRRRRASAAFPDDVDLALADAFLEIQIAEHEGAHFYRGNPALWTGEAIFSVDRRWSRATSRRSTSGWRPRRRACAAIPRVSRRRAPDARGTRRPRGRRRRVAECGAAEILFGEACRRGLPTSGRPGDGDGGDAASCAMARDGVRCICARLARRGRCRPRTDAHVGRRRHVLDLLLRRGHWCDDADRRRC